MASRSSHSLSITADQVKDFDESGFVVVEDLLLPEEVQRYRTLYDQFLRGEIQCDHMRSDLGGHASRKKKGTENVTQIMWPSDLVPGLIEETLHQTALVVARQLLGNDMAFDFDMLIDKAPLTDTPTPWHQDAAYWIDMPDRRAASCWVALDEATIDNGCMWFVPGSHLKDLRAHQPAGQGGGALECAASEAEGMPIPLKPGSATFHHGATLHDSRGNSTDTHRRAYIVNFRPEAMVQFEREQGFDHGRSGNVTDRWMRSDDFRGESQEE